MERSGWKLDTAALSEVGPRISSQHSADFAGIDGGGIDDHRVLSNLNIATGKAAFSVNAQHLARSIAFFKHCYFLVTACCTRRYHACLLDTIINLDVENHAFHCVVAVLERDSDFAQRCDEHTGLRRADGVAGEGRHIFINVNASDTAGRFRL